MYLFEARPSWKLCQMILSLSLRKLSTILASWKGTSGILPAVCYHVSELAIHLLCVLTSHFIPTDTIEPALLAVQPTTLLTILRTEDQFPLLPSVNPDSLAPSVVKDLLTSYICDAWGALSYYIFEPKCSYFTP
jgi:hypothetical protein